MCDVRKDKEIRLHWNADKRECDARNMLYKNLKEKNCIRTRDHKKKDTEGREGT